MRIDIGLGIRFARHDEEFSDCFGKYLYRQRMTTVVAITACLSCCVRVLIDMNGDGAGKHVWMMQALGELGRQTGGLAKNPLSPTKQ